MTATKTTCSTCGQPLHPGLKPGTWAHRRRADHSPTPAPQAIVEAFPIDRVAATRGFCE